MLDSNVVIDVVREPNGPVASTFQDKGIEDLSVSVVVAGELRHGMNRNPQARANPRMENMLSSFRIDSVDADVSSIYGVLRRDLEAKRKSISPNDYWIVAHALSAGAILVTSDRAIHDAGIEGLNLEDWRGIPADSGQD